MVQLGFSRPRRKRANGSRRVDGGSFSANATLDLLRRFEPMAGFDWHSLSSLVRHSRELYMPAGRVLVQPPRRLRGVWYLSAGTLIDEHSGVRLSAGSMRCRQSVYPGHTHLRTLTAVRLLFFAEDCVPLLQTHIQSQAQGQIDASGSWLDILAASPLLRLLYQRRGAAGWQSWLRDLQSVDVDANQNLVSCGADGDYFYVVQRGVAVVENERELAQIGIGGFFGEDALLSDQPRNAAVSMPDGGRVLRGDAAALFALVDDLWWVLARNASSWRNDNEPLIAAPARTTAALREWLARLPVDQRYGLVPAAHSELQDLLLLLLVHRGYSVVLREHPDSDRVVED